MRNQPLFVFEPFHSEPFSGPHSELCAEFVLERRRFLAALLACSAVGLV
jgi:hypothetical protein